MSNTAIRKKNKSTLSNDVFELIKEDIIFGRLAQGSKVIEQELALKYGISRGPLREAIQRLEGIKLVIRAPRAGVRVVTLDERRLSDIYQVREALEGMSARLAAENMEHKGIEELWQLLEQHENNIRKRQDKTYCQQEGDLDFHYRIASNSQNQLLMQLLSSELYQLLRMCRLRSSKRPARANKALIEHRMIVEAISNRDGELAEMLMRRHISGAWQIVKQTLVEDQK